MIAFLMSEVALYVRQYSTQIVFFYPPDLYHRPSDFDDLQCKFRALDRVFCSPFEGWCARGRSQVTARSVDYNGFVASNSGGNVTTYGLKDDFVWEVAFR